MATVPGAPHALGLTPTGTDQILVDWGGDGSDGGSAILEREVWGSNNTTPTYLHTFTGSFTWYGLAQGASYNFWARARNAVGWGPYSSMRSATTWDVPPPPNGPTFTEIEQTSVYVDFVDKGTGGPGIIERQLGYTQVSPPSAPSTTVPFSGSGGSTATPVTGLNPGEKYWFSARVRNMVGWSPWSIQRQVTLLAGARVNVGGVSKRAVPYVRVAGVWKVAQPMIKDAGVWKETSS